MWVLGYRERSYLKQKNKSLCLGIIWSCFVPGWFGFDVWEGTADLTISSWVAGCDQLYPFSSLQQRERAQNPQGTGEHQQKLWLALPESPKKDVNFYPN